MICDFPTNFFNFRSSACSTICEASNAHSEFQVHGLSARLQEAREGLDGDVNSFARVRNGMEIGCGSRVRDVIKEVFGRPG